MTRTEAWIALNLIPQVGPVRVRRLLEFFETPERILTAKASEIVKVQGFGMAQAEGVAGWESQIDLAAELKKISESGLTILTQEPGRRTRSRLGTRRSARARCDQRCEY